jgi:hypothetical protein
MRNVFRIVPYKPNVGKLPAAGNFSGIQTDRQTLLVALNSLSKRSGCLEIAVVTGQIVR